MNKNPIQKLFSNSLVQKKNKNFIYFKIANLIMNFYLMPLKIGFESILSKKAIKILFFLTLNNFLNFGGIFRGRISKAEGLKIGWEG